MKLNTQTTHWILEKTFSIEIKTWIMQEGKRCWNVYAHVYDTHPLCDKPEFLRDNSPLHGGCTFDRVKKCSPIGGIRYDFQRNSTVCVVGSDYNHMADRFYSADEDPMDIPDEVLSDAKDLRAWLLERVDPDHADNQAEQLETTTKVKV